MSPSKNLLIGLSGSIAAFKVATVISYFRKKNWQVRVITTPSALEFVGLATLEGLSGHVVLSSDFVPGKMMSHIELARWADIFLIAPATAKTINNLAMGTGEGLLISTYLAYESTKPFFLAPAMNSHMYSHPTTQNSIQLLKNNGVKILQPQQGDLACGEVGDGRMMEPEDISTAIELAVLPKKPGSVLVTMGGTRVPIDEVRSITNTSSGSTGAQLVDDLIMHGYSVTVLKALTAVKPRYANEVYTFDTYTDLEQILETHLKEFQYDYIVHMAAVSDFTVDEYTKVRPKKIPSGQNMELHLVPTQKLITRIRRLNPKSCLIGFKLTVDADSLSVDKAVGQVFRQGADVVVHNDTSQITSLNHKFSLYFRDPTSHRSDTHETILAPLSVNNKTELVSLLVNNAFKTSTPFQKTNEVQYDTLS